LLKTVGIPKFWANLKQLSDDISNVTPDASKETTALLQLSWIQTYMEWRN